jgi:hypothetical protein
MNRENLGCYQIRRDQDNLGGIVASGFALVPVVEIKKEKAAGSPGPTFRCRKMATCSGLLELDDRRWREKSHFDKLSLIQAPLPMADLLQRSILRHAFAL